VSRSERKIWDWSNTAGIGAVQVLPSFAAGSWGWVISPLAARPSPRVVCPPSYSSSITELGGERRSASLQQLIGYGLGIAAEGFLGAGERVCWWGEVLTDAWLGLPRHLLTNLW